MSSLRYEDSNGRQYVCESVFVSENDNGCWQWLGAEIEDVCYNEIRYVAYLKPFHRGDTYSFAFFCIAHAAEFRPGLAKDIIWIRSVRSVEA